ncbi:hypothetical protein TorRG33x02_195620 [Trema orientale]|uniref:Uncharacterized protein n=1 Tax=Trema orientale TaxID=63057 RepID=A0A2P5EGF8_TREOI|nr:hypothetical protein TorRG33x02_195620 [Trema orientale]
MGREPDQSFIRAEGPLSWTVGDGKDGEGGVLRVRHVIVWESRGVQCRQVTVCLDSGKIYGIEWEPLDWERLRVCVYTW